MMSAASMVAAAVMTACSWCCRSGCAVRLCRFAVLVAMVTNSIRIIIYKMITNSIRVRINIAMIIANPVAVLIYKIVIPANSVTIVVHKAFANITISDFASLRLYFRSRNRNAGTKRHNT